MLLGGKQCFRDAHLGRSCPWAVTVASGSTWHPNVVRPPLRWQVARCAGGHGAPACLGFTGRFLLGRRPPPGAASEQAEGASSLRPRPAWHPARRPAPERPCSSPATSPVCMRSTTARPRRWHAWPRCWWPAHPRSPSSRVRRGYALRSHQSSGLGVRGVSQPHGDWHGWPSVSRPGLPEVALALKAGTEGHGRWSPLSPKERCPPLPSVPTLLLVIHAALLHVRCADLRDAWRLSKMLLD